MSNLVHEARVRLLLCSLVHRVGVRLLALMPIVAAAKAAATLPVPDGVGWFGGG
jgi:hypothetical protein